MQDLIFKHEAYEIVGACMEVHKMLGPGFLESVYQKALAREFLERKIPFMQQWGIDVFYKGEKLDKRFFADFVCFEEIIVEIKFKFLINLFNLLHIFLNLFLYFRSVIYNLFKKKIKI